MRKESVPEVYADTKGKRKEVVGRRKTRRSERRRRRRVIATGTMTMPDPTYHQSII
jgi:hypothetical protein